MNGVIIAGGKGSRLYPITLEIPKPLLTVGRKSIIQHLLDLFRKHRIERTYVIVHESDLPLFERWKREYENDDVEFAVEGERLGTWGGIQTLVREHMTSTFVVSNGDELKEVDLSNLIAFHKGANALVTLGTVTVENPHEYGVVESHPDGRIRRFFYKPERPTSNYIMAGVYVAEPSIFEIKPDKGYASFEEHLLPKIIERDGLYEYRLAGRWNDCGTFERYESAIRDWTGKTRE
jgi:NDP-sugar pyrophosphorylase family protein